MNTAIIITPSDNVAVALVDIAQGTSLELGGNTYTVTNDIPRGHKFALRNIELNEDVIKYGYSIGHATELIEAGSHIHSHNLKTSLEGTLTYTY
ncbi:MAG: Altronate dehydratase, partial [Bacteroidota bacterium]